MQLLLNSQDQIPTLTPEQELIQATEKLAEAAKKLAKQKNESTAPTTGAQLLTG